MGKSYKAKKRKVLETQEYRDYLDAKKREKMAETLDRVGYRSKEEYSDCVSWLAW